MYTVGIDVPANEFFRYEGRTGASTINLIFNQKLGREATEEECRSLYRRKTELFSSLPPVSPMPGAADMLDFMKQIGMKRVLVTGSGQSSLISRLDTDYPLRSVLRPDMPPGCLPSVSIPDRSTRST